MLSKFAIDYIVRPQHNTRVSTHFTDDPIEVEEFLMHLLLARTHIKCIRHDGADLSRNQFDQMLKKAAERLAIRVALANPVAILAALRRLCRRQQCQPQRIKCMRPWAWGGLDEPRTCGEERAPW
jgi:hypothetical protein